jgi:alkanesulfonate monooxygenase SsuD/methylene tetrahydromethanopterin reductase-like flavin-dependent oxidoreductase (luciferase family)
MAGRIGPPPAREGGPEIILGGHSPGALARAARQGAGWIAGGAGPEAFSGGAGAFRAAWQREGRTGAPRLLALTYFALGDSARKHAESYLRGYYESAPPFAEMVLSAAAIDEDQIAERITAFEQAGCDELIFVPCSADLDQVELLHSVVH